MNTGPDPTDPRARNLASDAIDDDDIFGFDDDEDLDPLDAHHDDERLGGYTDPGAARRAPARPRVQASSGAATDLPVVYLHIGTYKAGTSFLQGRLVSNAAALKEDGVLFPGPGLYASQVAAVRDVLGWDVTGKGQAVIEWADLRDEIHAWRGRAAVVSMEFLSAAPRRKVERIVSSLAPAEVNIIITARDLMRVIPSAWQESTQNRQTRSWAEFVEGVTGENPSGRDARFWFTHDVSALIDTWADSVGAAHVHVVTLPPPGSPPEVLWTRFSTVLGIDPDRYPEDPAAGRTNASLDTASAELLRRVNAALPADFPKPMYGAHVKKFLAKQVLVNRTGGTKPVMPEEYRPWAIQRSQEIVAAIQRAGVRVVGDLDDLVPADRPSSAGPPDAVSDKDVADAGVDAVVGLLGQLASRRGPRGGQQNGRGQRAGQRAGQRGGQRGGGRRAGQRRGGRLDPNE